MYNMTFAIANFNETYHTINEFVINNLKKKKKWIKQFFLQNSF